MSEKKKNTASAAQKSRVKFKYLPKSKKKKIILWSVGSLVVALVVVLLGMQAYKWLMNTVFKPNDIYYKDSYTVSDEKAVDKKDVVIATASGEELTNALLKMFYWKEVTNFATSYADYLSWIGLDMTKPLDQQKAMGTDGYTWQMYFIDSAINSWQRFIALYKEGVKADIGLPEDLREEFEGLRDELEELATENDYADAEEMIHKEIGAGVTYEEYMAYFEMYYLGMAYFENLSQAIEMPMEEIEAFYEKYASEILTNYEIDKESGMAGTVRHILIKPVDEDGDGKFSEEEWKECLFQAEESLEEWATSSGKEEDFANLAKTLSEDEDSKVDGGLRKGVYKGSGVVAEAFENWAADAERKPGDTGIVQTAQGYHIMYYVSGEESWITVSREELHSELLQEKLNEVLASYIVKVDFKKLVLDEMVLGVAVSE